MRILAIPLLGLGLLPAGAAFAGGTPTGLLTQIERTQADLGMVVLVVVHGPGAPGLAGDVAQAFGDRPILVMPLVGPGDPMEFLEAELARQGVSCGMVMAVAGDGAATLRTRGTCTAQPVEPVVLQEESPVETPSPTVEEPPPEPEPESEDAPRPVPDRKSVVVRLFSLNMGRDTGLTWDPGPGFMLRWGERGSLGVGAMIRGPGYLGVDVDFSGRLHFFGWERSAFVGGTLGLSAVLGSNNAGVNVRGGVELGYRWTFGDIQPWGLAPVLEWGTNLHVLASGMGWETDFGAMPGFGTGLTLGLAF